MIKKIFKGLFVSGLLLLPTFSFAVNRENEFGAYEDIGGNLCTINKDLSFDCENTNNILVGQNSSNWQPSSTSFFWTSSGLAVYHFKNYNPVVEVQGYVDGFKACRDTNCSYYNSDPNYTIDEFLDFVDTHQLSGWIWYSTSTNPGTAGIIFTFTDGTRLATLPINYNNFTPYDFGLHGRGLEANYSNLGVILTPISNVLPLPDYNIDPVKKITVREAIQGCSYAGLDTPYCFGGFPIDNIFEPGEDYEAFTGYIFGSGASIYDLYYLYSGAYSTPQSFMGSLRSAYVNKQFNRFYTEPKALFMFVHQYYSMYDRGQINFQFSDVWDFCDLLLKVGYGEIDFDDEYTGGNLTCIRGYQDKISNESQGGFQLSGFLNSGSGIDGADDFFGRVSNLFNSAITPIDGQFDPIIPSYIVVFMLAFILIRLISH